MNAQKNMVCEIGGHGFCKINLNYFFILTYMDKHRVKVFEGVKNEINEEKFINPCFDYFIFCSRDTPS